MSCLKSGIKPFPCPRGVEGQNLYDYFFIVREISQLASTSCAKHGFSQWLPAISNRSLKFSCVSSEFFFELQSVLSSSSGIFSIHVRRSRSDQLANHV